MIEKFELLLDLLYIENKDSYIDIAKKIESNKYEKFQISHKHWFLFDAFNKFLKHEISLEEFVQIGDIESKSEYRNQKFDYQDLLSDDLEKLGKTLFILSEIDILWKLSRNDLLNLNNKLNSIGSEIVLL